MGIALLLVLGIFLLIIFYVISVYNRLVRMRNTREQSFADIDVQLKQRHDLIPQLVETVRGYMKHERELLTEITAARAGAMNARTIDEKISAENRLSGVLGGLRVAVEAYPDLKANQNFLNLQEEISDIENKLAAARRFFNSTTRELNNAIEVFPANIIAGMFGFRREQMFDLGEGRAAADQPPQISF